MLHYWEGSSQPFPKLHQDLAVCKILEYFPKLKELMHCGISASRTDEQKQQQKKKNHKKRFGISEFPPPSMGSCNIEYYLTSPPVELAAMVTFEGKII